MAQTDNIQRLVLAVEANTKSYERSMKKLEGITNKASKAAEGGLKGVDRALKDIETRSGRAGAAVARMERELAVAATKSVAPLKLNNAQLQNMQFQLSDIAQGLATGNQSPFTIIAQQGSQIAQIFGPGSSVTSAFKATGAAIVSFVTNPINLAVIGIAAATAAAPMLWEAFSGSQAKSAEDTLKEIDDLLRDIEASNVAAAQSARKFINAAQGTDVLLARLQLTEGELRGGLKSALDDLLSSAIAFNTSFMDGLVGRPGDLSDEMRELVGLTREVRAGQSTVEDFRNALSRIMLNPEAEQSVKDLASQLFDASMEARRLEASLNGVLAATSDIENTVRIDNARFGDDSLSSDQARESLNRGILSARRDRGIKPAKKTAVDRARERAVKALDREKKKTDELIESLERERSLIGATNVERQISNNLRRLGTSATSAQRSQVETLTQQIYAESQAWEAAQSAQDFFAQTAFNAMDGLIDGSKSAEDAVRDLANQIADAALQAALLGSGPLSGLFGGGSGGGILGALFGGLGRRANGGPVAANTPYLVGERGPEVFIPSGAGKIDPGAGRPANDNVTFSPVTHIDARGADAGAIARIERGMMERDAAMAKTVQGITRTTQMRRIRG